MSFPFVFSLILLLGQDEPIRYSHLYMPRHGTLYGERLYGFFGKLEDYHTTFSSFDVKNAEKKGLTKYWYPDNGVLSFWYRHNIHDNTLWLSQGPGRIQRFPFDEVALLDISNEQGRNLYFKKYEAPPLTQEEPSTIYLGAAGKKDRQNYQGALLGPAQGVAGFGYVPVAEDTCKVFMLFKEGKKIEAWDTRAKFDGTTKRWQTVADERNLETFNSPFIEDFYVFVRKNDYYFVTQSGKLYYAPPPKNGEKSRTMKALWQGDKFPIAAVIEDADHDRVWLFTKAKSKLETQAVFFEMAPEIRTEKFDHSKLRPVNVEGRAKTLLEYLPLIRAGAK